MLKILFLFVIVCSTVFAQKNYFVSKDGSGNFSTTKEVNNTNLKPGDIVSFKSGEQFSDAVLECKEGVTYNTYGGTDKAIIGDSTSTLISTATAIVQAENVTLSNLKIYGYASATNVINIAANHFTISNCEVIGGEHAHDKGAYGIKQTNITKGTGHKILNNTIRDLGFGIYVLQPYDYEIAYNTMYNFYRLDGRMNYGGTAIHGWAANNLDKWDTEYTFHIHHNDISKWEYVAMAIDFTNMLVEYNVFHDNLDERIYRGGVKHTGLGKWCNSGDEGTTGSLGTIVRYNYVYNIIRFGQTGYIYGAQTKENVRNKTFVTVSTNNTGDGKDDAVYQYVVPPSDGLFSSFGNHYGDQINDVTGSVNGESPDALISGEGWINNWIHNNIFNNIYLKISIRSATHPKPTFRDDLSTYFINNTLIDVGLMYRNRYGVIKANAGSNSPHVIANNIILASNPNTHYAIDLTERYYTFVNNILPLQNGIIMPPDANSYPSTSNGDNHGLTFRYRAYDDYYGGNVPQNNYYLTNPGWIDTSSTIFVSNLGVIGYYIPDVRITESSAAYDAGKDYNQLGDTYTVLGRTHQMGKDPLGRSFAYDILGNLRTTNDIGAVGSANGSIINPPSNSNSSTPTINSQPVSISANLGDNVTFTVSADTDDEIGYQWWKSPYINESESKIVNDEKYSGATTNTLTIKNVSSEDSNVKYLCEVYNKKDHSNLWINSNAASIIITQTQGAVEYDKFKVLLEGPINNGQMNVTINTGKVFPKKQPYNTSPWNFESNIELNDVKENFVDWLLIELRKEMNQISYRKAAILLNDGTVVNSDGSKLSFNDISNDSYYISVAHRNHLSIISSAKIKVENNKPILYNFTDLKSKAYGTNPMTDIGGGVFAMFSGDADANGIINNLDFGKVANSIPFKGYSNSDLDMNGSVNVLDYNKINKNILKSSQIPK